METEAGDMGRLTIAGRMALRGAREDARRAALSDAAWRSIDLAVDVACVALVVSLLAAGVVASLRYSARMDRAADAITAAAGVANGRGSAPNPVEIVAQDARGGQDGR